MAQKVAVVNCPSVSAPQLGKATGEGQKDPIGGRLSPVRTHNFDTTVRLREIESSHLSREGFAIDFEGPLGEVFLPFYLRHEFVNPNGELQATFPKGSV